MQLPQLQQRLQSRQLSRQSRAAAIIAVLAITATGLGACSDDSGAVVDGAFTTTAQSSSNDSPTTESGVDESATGAATVDTQADDLSNSEWVDGAPETAAAAAAEAPETAAAAASGAASGATSRRSDQEAKASRRPAPAPEPRQSDGIVWDDRPPATVTTIAAPGQDINISARDAGVNPQIDTRDDNRSTFAMDVDTGSYSLARTQVANGQLPSFDSVRTEEFVNYFDQQYRSPKSGQTFAIHIDGTAAPFLRSDTRILRVGIQGRRIDPADRKPVNLTFVVDNSGSMEEDGKLQMVQGAMKTMLGSLRRGDTISIVGFSDEAWVLLPPTDGADRTQISSAIDRMSPTNGTNAEVGLKLGYEQAQRVYNSGATNRVILLSDGVANVGPTGPEAILATIGDYARRDIDLNTVGVGSTSYNDEMMERLADAGDGVYTYIDSQQEAERVFKDRFVSAVETIARNAKVQVVFDAESVSTYRLLGFENRAVADRDFTNNNVDAGEIGAGHSITALYEVTLIKPDSERNDSLASVRLRWEEPDGKVKETEQELRRDDVATRFSAAAPHLRLDVVTAAYAEVLREGPWSRIMDLTTVAANAQRLVDRNGPFGGNSDVEDFARLTEQAARLRPSRTW